MKVGWQAWLIAAVLSMTVVRGQEAPAAARQMFSPDLGMIDSERDEYATHLAAHAARLLAAAGDERLVREARRALGLASRLSPRNKRVLVVEFQRKRGVRPEPVEGAFTPAALARLLLTRGRLLETQGGAENTEVARYFIQLAAEMDPKNEDAVYAYEIQRLDHGEPDWSSIAMDSSEDGKSGK